MRPGERLPVSPRDLAVAATTYIANAWGCLDVTAAALEAATEYLAHLFWAERRAAYEQAASMAEETRHPDVVSYHAEHSLTQLASRIRALKDGPP